MGIHVDVLSSTVVRGGKAGELSCEKLSAIDASPLLLKTLNSPALKFDHALDLDRLHQATAALLLEYPIVGGRIKKLSKHDVASQPWLKAAPYCIDLAAPDAGMLLAEATTAAAASAISLNGALAAPFSMTSSKVQLPAWYQPMDAAALLRGKEPLLKLQLTHCSDGGSILAATMPHILVDSHSSMLMLTRLSELYRQASSTSSTSSSTPTASSASSATGAAAGPAGNGIATNGRSGSAHINGMPGVAFQSLRTSGSAQPLSPAPSAASGVIAAADGVLIPAPAVAAASIAGAAAVVQIPAPSAVSKAGRSWSKGSLAPTAAAAAGGKDWQSPGTLESLSLDLQSAEAPSLGSTLGWLCAAVKEGIAAAQKFPGAASRLTALLLHIPKADVQQLKALAAAGSLGEAARHISTNDAVSALVWLTFCNLRGRPMPGSSSSSSKQGAGCTGGGDAAGASSAVGALGMAVDLRQNCTDLKQQLPADYFGNAAWCLHIASPGPSRQSWDGSSSNNTTADPEHGVCRYAPALQAAAGAVRGGLSSFRQTPQAGGKLLQLVAAQQAAPKSVLVRNLSRLVVKVDAFITSWNFPTAVIDFGHGPPAEYACVVRPTPPWQAAVLPSRPQADGAVQLLLTVPASAAAALKWSPVLQQLVPHASVVG